MSEIADLPGMIVQRGVRRGSAAFFAAAGLAIGHALQLSDGIYDAPGIRWLSVGIVLAWAGIFVRTSARRQAFWDSIVWAVCLGGLGWEFHELATTEPLWDATVVLQYVYYWLALPALAIATALAILTPRRWRAAVFIPLLLLVYTATGAYLLHRSNNPYIDVFQVTKDSCQALSRGEDPYAIDFPDIYAAHPGWETTFYESAYVYDGRIHFGYQYMPLSLEIAYVGYAIDGDYRLGNLLAVAGAAGFLAYAPRGRLGVAAASLLLLTARGFFVLERGWSEPAVVLCLALVVFCACRKRGWLPGALGLLMVSKQHLFLAAPAVLLLLPRPWQWRTLWPVIWKAAAMGAVVTLPLVLWNVHAFWHSAVAALLGNPFRADSFNYAAGIARAGGPVTPSWVAFVLAAIAAAICIWQAGMGPMAFCGSVAVIYLSFFAFASQAFCNYYFFSIGTLYSAVAAGQARWPYWTSDEGDA